MSRTFRQFIAVLLAVWLPLFGGNALAASIAMQSGSGAASDAAVATHDTAHAAMDHCAMHDETANDHVPDTGCKHSAACQLACSGFVATASLDVALPLSSGHAITPYSTFFKSRFIAPLDTPPLARV